MNNSIPSVYELQEVHKKELEECKQQIQELKRQGEVDLKALGEVSDARDVIVKQNEKLQAEKQELLNDLGDLQSRLKAAEKKEKDFCKRIEGLQKDINTAENALYYTREEQQKFCQLLSKELGVEGVNATADVIAKEALKELKRRGINQERAEQDAINLTIELNNLKRLMAEEPNKRIHTVNIR